MTARGESSYYVLGQEERLRLLATCDNIHDLCVIQFPLYLGLRISEYLHLQLSWLNHDSSISVPRESPCSCAVDEARGYWQPKTKAGIRTVYATDKTWELLKLFFVEYPDGFVGSGETRQSLYADTKKLLVAAKLRMPGAIAKHVAFPHALRATCATWLAENDMNAAEVCQFMGWTDLRIAQRYINKAIAARNTPKKLRLAGA